MKPDSLTLPVGTPESREALTKEVQQSLAEPVDADALANEIKIAAENDDLEKQIKAAAAEENPSFGERLYGVSGQVTQGALMGFADEAKGAIRALWDRVPGEDYVEAYVRNRNRAREELKRFEEANPKTSIASQFGGGAGAGLFTGGAGVFGSAGKTAGGRILAGAGTGAAFGGIYGAGTAEELGDVPRDLVKGAVTGAITGSVLTGGMEVARGVYNAAKGAVFPSKGAQERISKALARDDVTPDELAGAMEEARQLGRPATSADVGGENLRRQLETASQTPGAAAQFVDKAMADRNKEQLSRMSKTLLEGTGIKHVSSIDVEDVIGATMKMRSDAAKPVYAKAMDFSAEFHDDIVEAYRKVVASPLGKSALPKAKKIANAENFDELPLMERIHALKQGMDDVVGESTRKGEFGVARKARELLRNEQGDGLLDLVDAVNPYYKTARKIWETDTKYLGAIESGRDILSPSYTAQKLQHEFRKLTDHEQEAFRIGALDAIVTRMRQQSSQEPNLVKILRSPEIRDKLKIVMHPDTAKNIDKILDIEDAMFRTATQVRKGSQTAQRMATMAEQESGNGIYGVSKGIESLVSLAIKPLQYVFIEKIPGLTRAAKDRFLARQNEELARKLLTMTPDEARRIPIGSRLSRNPVEVIPGAIAVEQDNPQ